MNVHLNTRALTRTLIGVSVQVNVMPVISHGFDYRPEEVLCSQAVGKAEPSAGCAQAPQPRQSATQTDNSLAR